MITYANGLINVDPFSLREFSKSAIKTMNTNSFMKSIIENKSKILYIRGTDSGKWSQTFNILNKLGVQKEIIDNAGHLTHIDKPECIINLINKFII